jgi:hypothetical protein
LTASTNIAIVDGFNATHRRRMAGDTDAWVDEATEAWKKLRPEAELFARRVEDARLGREGTKLLAMFMAAYFTGTASIVAQRDPKLAHLPLRELAKGVVDFALDAVERNFSAVPPAQTN